MFRAQDENSPIQKDKHARKDCPHSKSYIPESTPLFLRQELEYLAQRLEDSDHRLKPSTQLLRVALKQNLKFLQKCPAGETHE